MSDLFKMRVLFTLKAIFIVILPCIIVLTYISTILMNSGYYYNNSNISEYFYIPVEAKTENCFAYSPYGKLSSESVKATIVSVCTNEYKEVESIEKYIVSAKTMLMKETVEEDSYYKVLGRLGMVDTIR